MSTEGLTSWKPGQSGNPAGKPKGARNRATIIREILSVKMPDGTENEYRMMAALFEKACTGDVTAVKEIQDTVYGKIADKMLTAETEPERLNGDITDEILKHVPAEELERIVAKLIES